MIGSFSNSILIVSIWLNGFLRNGVSVAPPAYWPILEFVVQAAVPDDDIIGFLDDFDQGLENFKELVFAIKLCTPCISGTVISDEQEIFRAIKPFNWIRSPNINMYHLSWLLSMALGWVPWDLDQSLCDCTHWTYHLQFGP